MTDLKLSKLLNKIHSLSFVRNTSYLIFSSITAQVLNFLFYPFITRSVAPADFGYFAFLLSFVSVFSVVSFGRLELLFPKYLVKKRHGDLLFACLFIFLIVSLLLILAMIIFTDLVFAYANLKYVQGWNLLVLLSFWTLSLATLVSNYQVAIGRFKILSFGRLLQPFITISSTLLAMKFFNGLTALTIGVCAANVVLIFIGLIDILFFYKFFFQRTSFQNIFSIIKENRKMLLINSPHAIMDSFQTNMFNLLVGKYYAIDSVGQFSLANRILRAPVSTIGSSISQVFYHDIHRDEHLEKQSLKSYVKKVLIILLCVSLIIFVSSLIFAKYFFTVFFGHKWATSSHIFIALLPWVLTNLISSPLSQLSIFKNRQGTGMLFGILYNLSSLFVVFILGSKGVSFSQNIFITSLIAGLVNMIYIWWLFRIISNDDK